MRVCIDTEMSNRWNSLSCPIVSILQSWLRTIGFLGNGHRPYRALHVAGDTTNRRRQKALQACSLVCRSWVYPSRRNLFRHLRIQGLTKLSRFKVLFPQYAQDVLHLEFYFTSYKVNQIFIDVSHTFSALRKLTFDLMSLGTIPVEFYGAFDPYRMSNLPWSGLSR